MSLIRTFKEFDIFRKVHAEHRERSQQKPVSRPVAACQLLTFFAVVVTALIEVSSLLSPVVQQRFEVDNLSSVDADKPRKIRVLLNITVHDFPCLDVSLDYQDVMGTRAVDVRSTIFKERLKADGTPVVSPLMKNDPKSANDDGSAGRGAFQPRNATGNVTCGPCYGALPEGQCCNTCADVLYAYRLKRWALPRIETIEQCKHDGSGKATYQPPQLLSSSEYNSEDYLPRFTQFGNLSASPGEAKINTPFNFRSNKEWPELAPINWSAILKSAFNELDDDEEDEDSSQGENSTKKTKEWPECIARNVILHGFDLDEALMTDLTPYGAKTGCFKDNCSHTDKFQCYSMERCAEVCRQIDGCRYWTHGKELEVSKCWLRSGRHDRQRRFGFSSGSRHCHPPNGPTEDTIPPAAPPRRLTSLEDDDLLPRFGSGFGSQPFLPLFSTNFESAESRMRKDMAGESCRLHGYFDTNKVPGNFHIGTHGVDIPSYLTFWNEPSTRSQQNMRHTINKLAFVDVEHEEVLNATQPLDGFESPKAFTFQYYLTITPGTREPSAATSDVKSTEPVHGYLFRAGSFVTNELLGPAVFFRMDIDPIRLVYYKEEAPWSKILVSLCAMIGGYMAVTSLVGALLDNVFDTFK